MIQTADAALGIIDEKLIRMKELSEQATTGTYNSTQRLMIDSEFQQMASEINRIAHATDFNGIKLIDGTLNGQHNGSPLVPTGAMKIHFGTGNDSAEDYYYVEIGDATLVGLGLARTKVQTSPVNIKSFADMMNRANGFEYTLASGIIPMSYIPKGATNLRIYIDAISFDDDIQLFTRDGYHLSGTRVTDDATNDITWSANGLNNINYFETKIITPENGFLANTNKYKMPGDTNETGLAVMQGNFNEGYGTGPAPTVWPINPLIPQTFTRDGGLTTMTISYSGDYARVDGNNLPTINNLPPLIHRPKEYVDIDLVTEDLLVFISGTGTFFIKAEWDFMPNTPLGDQKLQYIDDIKTQEKAQKMITRLNDAIVQKDKIRAHLGALQNRLENTISNIKIQAENLQASESRISDTDIATEMTEFTRNQILTQTAVAMLAQANSLPQMAMQLIGG